MAQDKPATKKEKLSKLAKLRDENFRNGTMVEAVGVRYLRPSADGHTNVWAWSCGCCGSTKNPEINTMFRDYTHPCDNCLADNSFDFRKYGA